MTWLKIYTAQSKTRLKVAFKARQTNNVSNRPTQRPQREVAATLNLCLRDRVELVDEERNQMFPTTSRDYKFDSNFGAFYCNLVLDQFYVMELPPSHQIWRTAIRLSFCEAHLAATVRERFISPSPRPSSPPLARGGYSTFQNFAVSGFLEIAFAHRNNLQI